MKLPALRGTGCIPRYGGGWMHQFGHTYLLQQELLRKPSSSASSDWFRAMELWHTARHEGLALNIAHYTNILRHCACEGSGAPWSAALSVLRQMKREALRADCTAVSLALQCCARDSRWEEALRVFDFFATTNTTTATTSSTPATSTENKKYAGAGLKLDSVSVAAVLQACIGAGKQSVASSFVASHSDSTATRRSVARCVDQDTLLDALRDLAAVKDVPDDLVPHQLSAASQAPMPMMITAPGDTGLSSSSESELEMVPVERAKVTDAWRRFFSELPR